MAMKKAYLSDAPFLKEIDEMRVKEQYIKVTALSFDDEKPEADLEGVITTGTLSIDGSSTIRRTASLTMVTGYNANDCMSPSRLLTINRKIRLELGIVNDTKKYQEEEIIWFPLGVFILNNISISHSSTGTTISMQLKDKMCLLNGENGGTFPAAVILNEVDDIDETTGEYTISQPTLFSIIQEVVNHFGGESLNRIIISDLDNRIKKVMKWQGSSPLFVLQTAQSGDLQYQAFVNESKAYQAYEELKEQMKEDYDDDSVSFEDYCASAGIGLTSYSFGQDVGYIYTDFVYPGDELVTDAGSSVTSVLDNIKGLLGNYEYFYDIDGNFVFQEMKNYLNTTQATVELNKMAEGDYMTTAMNGKSVYTFEDNTLVTSISSAPQFNNVKNDFIVWGSRENAYGNQVPIRYHLALDAKPLTGNTYSVFFFDDEDDNLRKAKTAISYPCRTGDAGFPAVGASGLFYHDKETNLVYQWNASAASYVAISVTWADITTTDWRDELYLQGAMAEPYGADTGYYYPELVSEWPKLYDTETGEWQDSALENSSELDFYMDFIDLNSDIASISIPTIGRRSKVVIDDSINCMFEPDIPNLVLIETDTDDTKELRDECINSSQPFMQLEHSLFSCITGGGNFNSAYTMVRDLLHEYTQVMDSVSVSAMPVYYLEPNNRITVRDPESGVYGDYFMSRISLPLTPSGTMSISASAVIEKL